MGRIKAVLFDIDGTLLTEMPLIQLFLPQVYEKLAKKLETTKEEARNVFLSEIFSRRDTYDWHDWNFFFELFGLNMRYEDLLRRYPHKLHVYPRTPFRPLSGLKDLDTLWELSRAGPNTSALSSS